MPVTVRWRGAELLVRARVVPRYCWTTASIDVLLNGESILKTGGQLRVIGNSTSAFEYQGTAHHAELLWGRYSEGAFPFTLLIDGDDVLSANIEIENWASAWLGGTLILVTLVIWLLLQWARPWGT